MSSNIINKGKKVWLGFSYIEAHILLRYLRKSKGNDHIVNIREKLKEAIVEQKERIDGTNVSN